MKSGEIKISLTAPTGRLSQSAPEYLEASQSAFVVLFCFFQHGETSDGCCAAASVASRENANGIPLVEKGLAREQDLRCVLEALLFIIQSDQSNPSYHKPSKPCTEPSTRQPHIQQMRVHVKKKKILASHIHVFDYLTLGSRHNGS